MKNIKSRILVSLAVAGLLAGVVLFGLKNSKEVGNGDIPIVELHGTYSIDYENYNELIGAADYVFVGTVMKEEETVYKFPVTTEAGKTIELPYTNYAVQVVENLKGNLDMENIIYIQKSGGITKDGSMYVIYEEDEMPMVGKDYIFFAYAQPDGSLLISGPNSNIAINTTMTISEENGTGEYQQVLNALENQTVIERERFVSIYESKN